MNSPADSKITLGVAVMCRGARTDGLLLQVLNHLGGYAKVNEVAKTFSQSAVSRLVTEGLVFTVKLSLKRGRGATGKKTGTNTRSLRWWSIFKKGFAEKTFVCNGRTGFLHLLFDALKVPTNRSEQCVFTHWLKCHCTEAERMAVMWHLGIRKFAHSMRKRNIQVDGIVKPIVRRK